MYSKFYQQSGNSPFSLGVNHLHRNHAIRATYSGRKIGMRGSCAKKCRGVFQSMLVIAAIIMQFVGSNSFHQSRITQ